MSGDRQWRRLARQQINSSSVRWQTALSAAWRRISNAAQYGGSEKRKPQQREKNNSMA